MSSLDGDGAGGLEGRFATWVREAARQGRVWILVDDEDFNTVLDDPDSGRALHMFFVSEDDAAGRAQGTSPAELSLDELDGLFAQIEERGEGLALWDSDSWIVAEPGALAGALKDADL